MSLWNDPDRWSGLCSGAACPICRQSEPLDVVAKLEASWATMQESAPVRGYVCLVSQTHAVDLHDLPEAAATAFMRDARKVSLAVASATGAVKMNYEIHGNSIPHFHMHFFPAVSRRPVRRATHQPEIGGATGVRSWRIRKSPRRFSGRACLERCLGTPSSRAVDLRSSTRHLLVARKSPQTANSC